MSSRLSSWQAALLGLVVVCGLVLGGLGVSAVASKQGFWRDRFEVSVGFAEVHDVTLGTPVRIRGVDAGQVVGIDYPADDTPSATVTLRLSLEAKFATRLYADAAAQVQSTGLLGGKVIAIHPGNPASGPRTSDELHAMPTADFSQAADRVAAVATEAEKLLIELRTGNGTLGKLVRDDALYREMTALATDARKATQRAEGTAAKVEDEVANVKGFVKEGQETLRSMKQGTDALQKLPIVRGYVENATTLLVRPDVRHSVMTYNANDLFEPETAILTDGGKTHLQSIVESIRTGGTDGEIVVAALCETNEKVAPSAAVELTKKQAEVCLEFLRSTGVHRTGWISRRTMTPIGLGTGPSPVTATEKLPSSYVQFWTFSPLKRP